MLTRLNKPEVLLGQNARLQGLKYPARVLPKIVYYCMLEKNLSSNSWFLLILFLKIASWLRFVFAGLLTDDWRLFVFKQSRPKWDNLRRTNRPLHYDNMQTCVLFCCYMKLAAWPHCIVLIGLPVYTVLVLLLWFELLKWSIFKE